MSQFYCRLMVINIVTAITAIDVSKGVCSFVAPLCKDK